MRYACLKSLFVASCGNFVVLASGNGATSVRSVIVAIKKKFNYKHKNVVNILQKTTMTTYYNLYCTLFKSFVLVNNKKLFAHANM